MSKIKGYLNDAINSTEEFESVEEKDKKSTISNLYDFPNNKKLQTPITVLYVDWKNSTKTSRFQSQDILAKYFRIYYKGVSQICRGNKEVKYIDYQGDGVLIFIENKGKSELSLAESIEDDIYDYVKEMNSNNKVNKTDLELKSKIKQGDVTICKVGRVSKNKGRFQNIVFAGKVVVNAVKEAEKKYDTI